MLHLLALDDIITNQVTQTDLTHLFALFLVPLVLFVVRVLAPVAVTIWVVGQKCIVRFTGCLHVALE